MKRILMLGLCCLSLSMGICQTTNGHKATIKETVAVDKFEKKLAAPKAQLIDVRTPEEYAEGHLKNAKNINFNSADFADRIAKLDKTKPVLVYCKAGGRSSAAADKMQAMGFTEVYNMDGGISSWGSAKKPVVKDKL